MGFLKRIGGFIAFTIFLTPCIIAGVYSGKLNTASTLAGWGVGIGVAIIEGAIIMFVAQEKSQKNMMLAVGVVLVGALPLILLDCRPADRAQAIQGAPHGICVQGISGESRANGGHKLSAGQRQADTGRYEIQKH